MMFSTLAVAALVRSVEAPSGRRIPLKKAPWSSSGRNPAGSILNSTPVAAQNASNPTKAKADRRTSTFTPDKYLLVVQAKAWLNLSKARVNRFLDEVF